MKKKRSARILLHHWRGAAECRAPVAAEERAAFIARECVEGGRLRAEREDTTIKNNCAFSNVSVKFF